jgi:hypothetical protein
MSDCTLPASIILDQEFPQGDSSDRIKRSWINGLKTVIKKRQREFKRRRYGYLRSKRSGFLPENITVDHVGSA